MESFQTELISVHNLDYDVENPRLPEDYLGKSKEKLAQYYYDYSVIAELASSMILSGFFPHEALIVKPEGEGRYKVVEGNRRLTALYLIHGIVDIPGALGEVDAKVREQLIQIPCVVSGDDNLTRKFIGFRHISGPKAWGAAEKARFLTDEIEAADESGELKPFTKVAKSVGSTAPSVRGYYIALKLLQQARDEKGVNIASIQTHRFGVWYRLASVPELKEYINFSPQDNEFNSIVSAIEGINVDRIAEVIKDMIEPPSGGRSVLYDSRDATNYGKVLMNSSAREVLRHTNDLGAAITLIEDVLIGEKIQKVCRKIEALTVEMRDIEYSPEAEESARKLAFLGKGLWDASKEIKDDDFFSE